MWISLMVLLAFAWGLWRIFDTRLQRGGEHAPYSTFSSQPRGARACLDALDGLRRIECRRNLVPLTRFKGAPTATVVFAGAASTFFSEDTAENFEKVEGWLEDGMEVVATMDTRALERRSFDGKKAYLNPWDIFDDGVEADPDSTDAKRKSPRRSPGLKRLLRGEISPGGDGGPASGKGKEGKEGKEDSTGAGEDEADAQVTLAERWNFKFWK